MFIRLLFTSIVLVIVVQSAVTNTSEGQPPTALASPKQDSLDEDYDLVDKKSNAEGSGAGANLDDYADEDEDQLSKITMISSSTFTTTKLTTSTKIPKQKNENITKKDDADANEFNDDYKDDLADDVDYNEITTTKITSTSLSSTLPSSIVSRPTPIRILFGFLTRPPIAAGVLAGLCIGILTSVILLICIVRRFHKRERTHSSYTTGLLYPNQYGYSKSPQEFYA